MFINTLADARRPMKRVVQKDEKGCGIACVAMLTGQSYGATRRLMYPDDRVKATRTRDLSGALASLGCEVGDRLVPLRTRRFQDLGCDAILKVNKRRSKWHWVVWDHQRQRVLDPLEPPSPRIEASSYLRVIPRP